jgi:alkyl hydroperoxide reductase subunit AhpC
VCPTEIIAFSEAAPRFAEVNAKVLAISCDSPEVKLAWSRTPRKRGGLGHMQIPLVADLTKSISADYGECATGVYREWKGAFTGAFTPEEIRSSGQAFRNLTRRCAD